jgi:hypothetical protein
MFGPSLKLDKNLMARAKKVADAAGYSSPQEFIEHVLNRELLRIEEESESKEDIVKKLKGLGYLE